VYQSHPCTWLHVKPYKYARGTVTAWDRLYFESAVLKLVFLRHSVVVKLEPLLFCFWVEAHKYIEYQYHCLGGPQLLWVQEVVFPRTWATSCLGVQWGHLVSRGHIYRDLVLQVESWARGFHLPVKCHMSQDLKKTLGITYLLHGAESFLRSSLVCS